MASSLEARPLCRCTCDCGRPAGYGSANGVRADPEQGAAQAAGPAPPVFSSREWDVFLSRTVLLMWLMIVQSISGFVLEQYTDLITRHPILTYSLTFLIGCGGNASAQTATIVVRGLATGQIGPRNKVKVLGREFLIGTGMGVVLALCGFCRIYFFFGGDVRASLAVSVCLMLLCVIATVLATILPLALHHWNVDPAHSAPTVAVAMDIIGVSISCVVFTAAFSMLPSTFMTPADR